MGRGTTATRIATAAIPCLISCLIAAGAWGQSAPGFPAKPVRIIVPYPAGGTADGIPRIVSEKLSARWGQPVLIDNRPGASGNIGAELVSRAEPDGYTLLGTAPGPLTINASLFRQLSYDPTRFNPVSLIATMPNALAVRAGLPANSVAELIALAKKDPGKLTYASQGNGTTSHLTTSLFEAMAGVKLVHVPYKGSAPALADLIGGQVDLMFDNVTSSLGHHRAGRIRILATATPRPVPYLPATVSEAGLTGFQAGTWVAIAAPPDTPEAIVVAVSQAIAEAVKLPDVQKRFADLGAEPIGSTPAETRAFVAQETAKWRRVIQEANVTLQ